MVVAVASACSEREVRLTLAVPTPVEEPCAFGGAGHARIVVSGAGEETFVVTPTCTWGSGDMGAGPSGFGLSGNSQPAGVVLLTRLGPGTHRLDITLGGDADGGGPVGRKSVDFDPGQGELRVPFAFDELIGWTQVPVSFQLQLEDRVPYPAAVRVRLTPLATDAAVYDGMLPAALNLPRGHAHLEAWHLSADGGSCYQRDAQVLFEAGITTSVSFGGPSTCQGPAPIIWDCSASRASCDCIEVNNAEPPIACTSTSCCFTWLDRFIGKRGCKCVGLADAGCSAASSNFASVNAVAGTFSNVSSCPP